MSSACQQMSLMYRTAVHCVAFSWVKFRNQTKNGVKDKRRPRNVWQSLEWDCCRPCRDLSCSCTAAQRSTTSDLGCSALFT